MANKIILKRSSVPNKAPVAGDVEYGELALNYNDGKLFYKKVDNTIESFEAGLQTINLTGAVTGSGTGDITTTLSATGATAGSYTNANITVGADGRITSVANGSASGLPDQTGNSGKFLTTDGSLLSWGTIDLSNYQPVDADLTAIGGLTGTSGILTKTAANTWSLDTNTYLTTTNAASTYQPVDADLTAIAGLSGTIGILKKTALNTWALDTTSYQPQDNNLTAIAGLGGTSGLLKKTAADTWTLDTSTYLTGITSGQVTTALGYTPYNSSNPNGYVTSSALSSYLPLSGGTVSGSITANEYYTNGWFRNNESLEGLYNQVNGNHFYSSAGSDWSITGNGGTVALRFLSNHQTTVRGYVYADTSNNIGFLNNTGNWGFRMDSSNNCYAGGSITASSDETLKTNWREYSSDFVKQLAQVKNGTYDRIDVDMTQDGVSAQSLRNLLPNSVSVGIDDKLSVNYGAAAMVSAVELAKDNVELRSRIERLEALVESLIGDNK